MTQYTVYFNCTASTGIKVEAADEDEAADLAAEQAMPQICAQCSGWNNPPGIELSEAWEISDIFKED